MAVPMPQPDPIRPYELMGQEAFWGPINQTVRDITTRRHQNEMQQMERGAAIGRALLEYGSQNQGDPQAIALAMRILSAKNPKEMNAGLSEALKLNKQATDSAMASRSGSGQSMAGQPPPSGPEDNVFLKPPTQQPGTEQSLVAQSGVPPAAMRPGNPDPQPGGMPPQMPPGAPQAGPPPQFAAAAQGIAGAGAGFGAPPPGPPGALPAGNMVAGPGAAPGGNTPMAAAAPPPGTSGGPAMPPGGMTPGAQMTPASMPGGPAAGPGGMPALVPPDAAAAGVAGMPPPPVEPMSFDEEIYNLIAEARDNGKMIVDEVTRRGEETFERNADKILLSAANASPFGTMGNIDPARFRAEKKAEFMAKRMEEAMNLVSANIGGARTAIEKLREFRAGGGTYEQWKATRKLEQEAKANQEKRAQESHELTKRNTEEDNRRADIQLGISQENLRLSREGHETSKATAARGATKDQLARIDKRIKELDGYARRYGSAARRTEQRAIEKGGGAGTGSKGKAAAEQAGAFRKQAEEIRQDILANAGFGSIDELNREIQELREQRAELEGGLAEVQPGEARRSGPPSVPHYLADPSKESERPGRRVIARGQ